MKSRKTPYQNVSVFPLFSRFFAEISIFAWDFETDRTSLFSRFHDF